MWQQRLFWISLILWAGISSTALASDGPQNTGILVLDAPEGQIITSQLQVDRTIFEAAFPHSSETVLATGPDADPITAIMSLFSVTVGDVGCSPSPVSTVANETVLTSVFNLHCSTNPHTIKVALREPEALPAGFTLGVRTPLLHFVLTAESPTQTITTSAAVLFWQAGIRSFYDNKFVDEAHVGRPHAMFYGGLNLVPIGLWFLLFTAVLFCGEARFRTALATLVAATAITAGLCIAVLAKHASLSFLGAKTITLTYLLSLIGAAIASFGWKHLLPRILYYVGLVVAMIALGWEQAIILRWLEGQTQVPLTEAVSSYFAAVFLCLLIICLILRRLVNIAVLARKKNPEDQVAAARRGLRYLTILLCAYPTLAVLAKWI